MDTDNEFAIKIHRKAAKAAKGRKAIQLEWGIQGLHKQTFHDWHSPFWLACSNSFRPLSL